MTTTPHIPLGRTRRGFTLMELMSGSVLMGMVAMITAQFWRFHTVQRDDLVSRVRASQELALALEALSTDLGSAVGASAAFFAATTWRINALRSF